MTLVWCPVCQGVAEVAIDRVAVSPIPRRVIPGKAQVIELRWCGGCGSSLESAA